MSPVSTVHADLAAAVAVAVADQVWLGALDGRQIATGVFQLTCRNRGGLLAWVEGLRALHGVDEVTIAAAEAAGLVRQIEAPPGSAAPGPHPVWVGEEDCGWLMVVTASPALHQAWIGAHQDPATRPPGLDAQAWQRQFADIADLRRQVAFWYPVFAAATTA